MYCRSRSRSSYMYRYLRRSSFYVYIFAHSGYCGFLKDLLIQVTVAS